MKSKTMLDGQKKGLVVGELVVLLVFVCLLLAVFLPFFIKAMERSAQRATMKEMMVWSQAIGDYIDDHTRAPSNPYGRLHYRKRIIEELSPYLKAVLVVDRWSTPFWVWTGPGNKQYGIDTVDDKDFIIASYGRKGFMEGWEFDKADQGKGAFEVKKLDDFEKDIVLFNHEFIRFPRWNKKNDI